MKKVSCIVSLVLLAGCGRPFYVPYVGDKYIVGQGGFPQVWYESKNLWAINKYPDAGVGFWRSGLPENQRCKLIGFAQDSNMERLAKVIIQNGGNIATKSDVSFPISFENNAGTLSVYSGGGNVTVHTFTNTSASSTTYYGYNVFYCEE